MSTNVWPESATCAFAEYEIATRVTAIKEVGTNLTTRSLSNAQGTDKRPKQLEFHCLECRGPRDAVTDRMQLVPNQIPPERLIISLDAQESRSVGDGSDSPFVLKGAGMMSGNGRWIFIGAMIGAMLLSIGGIIFGRHAMKEGDRFDFPTFIKARTHSVGVPGSAATPAPIVIQLSADMIRVSAIALGHPRLAVINGKTVAEGDRVTLRAPNSAVALILHIVKIGDGSIELSDGTKMFSAQLTIPSPPKPKAP